MGAKFASPPLPLFFRVPTRFSPGRDIRGQWPRTLFFPLFLLAPPLLLKPVRVLYSFPLSFLFLFASPGARCGTANKQLDRTILDSPPFSFFLSPTDFVLDLRETFSFSFFFLSFPESATESGMEMLKEEGTVCFLKFLFPLQTLLMGRRPGPASIPPFLSSFPLLVLPLCRLPALEMFPVATATR